MLWLLLESALRSLLLGAIVGLGLKLTRVRDPRAHMTAWTGVLIASLAMPGMMHWLVVTVPSSAPPLQVIEMIEAAPNALLGPVVQSIDTAAGPATPEPNLPAAITTKPIGTAAYPSQPATRTSIIDWLAVGTGIYLSVATVFLLRLGLGLILTWRLARSATPIAGDWTGCGDVGNAKVRMSDVVGMPVTFGSTILLPPDWVKWDRTKRQAVLSHERAHIAHGDFYILLLAMLNRAMFWFSPFAWWQVKRLAELAEMISDDAAIDVLIDRPSYADVLIEFAGEVPQAPAGLAMARANTVRQRVERILAAKGRPPRTGWRQQALVAAAVVPLIVICAGTIARSTPPIVLSLSGDAADPYVGWYQLNPLHALAVTRDGGRLFGQVTGGPRFELKATGAQRFAFADGNASIAFVGDGEQPAHEAVLQDPRFGERHAGRIDAAQGEAINAIFVRRMAAAPERFLEQAPMPGGKTALAQTISDLQQGIANPAHIGVPLAERLRRQSPPLQQTLAALGAVESIFFRGVGPGGYDIYGAKFANGSAEFRLLMGPGNVTEDLTFRPDGDATPGGIVGCAQEPMLKSAADAAPIKLLLFNISGSDIHLFGLDAQGKRARHITLGDNRTAAIATNAGNAWVVTDASGQCREVVVAGQHTRFVSVRHAGAGEEPDRFATRRSAPTPGSEDALLAYIDALARGEPDYSRMTPEVVTATRQQVELDQAILAKLGPVRAVSFRGVTPFDSDIYVVQFARGSAEWRIALANDGRIGRIALGPQY
jgi:beta-lactamase regulating signal transducer with metallopeptidase domain